MQGAGSSPEKGDAFCATHMKRSLTGSHRMGKLWTVA